jgi:aerobic carbon-monoxide dehydrogenase medium subunit
LKPAPFRYARPRNFADAVELLAAADHDVKILAGGQSLVPMMNLRLVRPTVLVDLNDVPGLDHVTPNADGGLSIGALVRHAALAGSATVIERAPLLAEAARHVGHAAIRHRGTLGGSLAHADPAAELPAALVALGAELSLHGRRGARTIQASEFFLGLLTTALKPDEILVEIRVPPLPGAGWGFAEVVRREGDFALAGVVALVDRAVGSSGRCESARLVGFGVGDRPVRFAAAEDILTSPSHDRGAALTRAAAAAAEECDPPDDVHASAEYRRHLATVLTEDAVSQALTRLDGARRS